MKKWKLITGMCVVFLLGMVAGGLLTGAMIRHRVHSALRGGSDVATDRIVQRLNDNLQLNASQKEKLRSVVQDAMKQMRLVRQQAHPQVQKIIEDAKARVRAMLKDEQIGKFDRLVAEQEAKWKKFASQHNPVPSPGKTHEKP